MKVSSHGNLTDSSCFAFVFYPELKVVEKRMLSNIFYFARKVCSRWKDCSHRSSTQSIIENPMSNNLSTLVIYHGTVKANDLKSQLSRPERWEKSMINEKQYQKSSKYGKFLNCIQTINDWLKLRWSFIIQISIGLYSHRLPTILL
jgi:hypothetical protein